MSPSPDSARPLRVESVPTYAQDRDNNWWHENHPESRAAGPGTDPFFSEHDGRTNEQRRRDIARHRFWADLGKELGVY